MPANDLPGVPLWKRRVLYGLATWTPLRWRPVRERAFEAQASVQRVRRHRLERRGDWSRSRPALFEIDVRLGTMLGRGGTFVEAGGHDGHTQSNTYYLERALGWRGLLVEPMPNLCRLARSNRPGATVVNAALTDPAGSGRPVRLHYAGLMSIVVGARGDAEADAAWLARSFVRGPVDGYVVEAPGRTLSEVIDEAGLGEIDLMSLDLEGYEPTALLGLDLDRHAPRWLLVEAHDDLAAARIAEILGDRYVRDSRFSEMDDLFRRADVPAIVGDTLSRSLSAGGSPRPA
jgi:FkbM family methyltransferase